MGKCVLENEVCACVRVFTVTVEMKGSQDYSSPADWPLMIVSIFSLELWSVRVI